MWLIRLRTSERQPTESRSSGLSRFSRTHFRKTNRNNPREEAKKWVGHQRLKRGRISLEEGVSFALICSGSVPKGEEGKGCWTEERQKTGLEEGLRAARCLRLGGKAPA